MFDMNAIVGVCDFLFVTLDTLRYDVAVECLASGQTPNLAALLPNGRWEERHTPGNFTYSAHQAFFAGFLPTPVGPGPHPRLFAAVFEGSETTSPKSFVFESATLVEGLGAVGYHTICIGGVGFFNRQNALARVMPDLFSESHWCPEMGVTGPASTERQFHLACQRLGEIPVDQRVFLFINVSAIHQPNCIFDAGATSDSPRTQAAALAYVDRCLPPLLDALRSRGETFCILCSDHGTMYGEDGYRGHRLSHPIVWTVPYAEFLLPGTKERQ